MNGKMLKMVENRHAKGSKVKLRVSKENFACTRKMKTEKYACSPLTAVPISQMQRIRWMTRWQAIRLVLRYAAPLRRTFLEKNNINKRGSIL